MKEKNFKMTQMLELIVLEFNITEKYVKEFTGKDEKI